ncbi:MAG TPA: YkvA family protein [Prosthecobacter sp.]|nr:YkvA family protein [Prosthecobacter sp.]
MPAPENQRDKEIARVTQRAQDIENKLPKLKKWMRQGKVILAMVKDYWSGRYREVPYWAISAGALTLLYVLNPLDVIPDVVPGFGYLDDATLVAFCLKLIERELEKYQAWVAAQHPSKAKTEGKVIDV